MRNDISVFIDCGAPSYYNKYSKKFKKKGAVPGTNLKNRVDHSGNITDSFDYVNTDSYRDYRQAYIDFLKENKNYIEAYSNLDVINNAELTKINQKMLEDAGLNPIPVFHYGQDLKYLKEILDAGYPYIAMGGLVPNSGDVLQPELDRIWKAFLIDENGFPKVKVHGFAVTSLRLMRRYPWYSVDSTTWAVHGRNGAIVTPKLLFDGYSYEDQEIITVSEKSPSNSEYNKHYDSMTPMKQALIATYIESKGLTLKDVRESYKCRDEMNIMYFQDLQNTFPEWPWKWKIEVDRWLI